MNATHLNQPTPEPDTHVQTDGRPSGQTDLQTDALLDALVAALDVRRQRAERSVIGSFAEQNGMRAEELTRLLRERSRSRQPAIPDEVQAAIDQRNAAADRKLILAEIRELGTRMGLVDAQAAFTLMDTSGVAVAEDGSVTGVQDALDALVKAKPYLAGANVQGTGSAGNFPRSDMENGSFAALLEAARLAGNHNLATAIISEAAAKGIPLR